MVVQTGVNFEIKKCTWVIANSTSQSCVGLVQYFGEYVVDVKINNNLIYVLSYNASYISGGNLTAIVRIMVDNSGSLSLIK